MALKHGTNASEGQQQPLMDPLFNDAPAKPGPKRDSGPLKLGGGGSIFDDDATRRVFTPTFLRVPRVAPLRVR
eukprot:s2140_g13.t1